MFRAIPHAEFPDRTNPDIRSLIGRRPFGDAGRFQGLLSEMRRLRPPATGLERDRDGLERRLLLLGVLKAHGPRHDRLLRYQLEEVRDELRRLAETRH